MSYHAFLIYVSALKEAVGVSGCWKIAFILQEEVAEEQIFYNMFVGINPSVKVKRYYFTYFILLW